MTDTTVEHHPACSQSVCACAAIEVFLLRDKLAASEKARDAFRVALGHAIDFGMLDHDDEDCAEDSTCECEYLKQVNAAFALDAPVKP